MASRNNLGTLTKQRENPGLIINTIGTEIATSVAKKPIGGGTASPISFV
jgi:hypothetical protein